MVGSSKTYGEKHIKDEEFLSIVASLGSIFGACRFIWSFMLDKYSYRVIYGTLIALQLVICFGLPQAVENRPLFLILVCMSFFCEGGHFVLAPTIYAKLFGAEGGIRVYSIGFSFIGLASFVNIFLMQQLLEPLGF